MKNSIIVLLILGTLSFSCTNSTSSNENEKISIPLKVGNSWTYDVSITDYQENPVNTILDTSVTFTVLSDTVVDEIHWFYIKSDNRQMNELKAGHYSNQEDGVYFLRSPIINPSVKKELYSTFSFISDFNHSVFSKATNSKAAPFIHNPDNRVPDRLIKNDAIIASVTYQGESINEEFNSTTYNYTWNYYQQFIGDRVYAINPFDLNYSLSNELGFTVYEQAYVSTKGSTEEDPRLQLLMIIRFELTKFKKAE